MIFVAGTMNIQPDSITAFKADVAAMRPQVLAEAGCQHYSLLVEDETSGLINVMEIWDDDAALVVHLAQPWIASFFATYSPKLTATTVRIFDVARERPLPGM